MTIKKAAKKDIVQNAKNTWLLGKVLIKNRRVYNSTYETRVILIITDGFKNFFNFCLCKQCLKTAMLHNKNNPFKIDI